MLDFADFVAINKFDRKGAEDALRDVRKQYQRNRELFGQTPTDEMPVFGTMAARFNDDGVTALYQALLPALAEGPQARQGKLPLVSVKPRPAGRAIVPAERVRYLAEIADSVRGYHKHTAEQAEDRPRAPVAAIAKEALSRLASRRRLRRADRLEGRQLTTQGQEAARHVAEDRRAYAGDEYVVKIRDKEIRTKLTSSRCPARKIRKVSLPTFEDDGEVLRFLMKENVPAPSPTPPACSPSSARTRTRPACSPAKATPSAPTAASRRSPRACRPAPVHRLRLGHAVRLRPRPASGHLRQDRQLRRVDRHARRHEGALRRLRPVRPTTSVSMTINGPAPIILAMFFNTAIDQQIAKFKATTAASRPRTKPEDPRMGAVTVRGTVQADILKEDQGQNTCIFSHRVRAQDDGRHPGVLRP
jgi:methylmalonyl-CoA mutase